MAYLLIPLVPADEQAQVPENGTAEPLAAWVAVASASTDACLVLDHRGRILGCSQHAAELLGEPRNGMRGRSLVGDVIHVVDFSAQAGPGDSYAMRIPPLLALTSEMPARGLLRVRHGDGRHVTLDAVSAPLHAPAGVLAGSVSFLAAVGPS
jgi:PAS domain-containing protein